MGNLRVASGSLPFTRSCSCSEGGTLGVKAVGCRAERCGAQSNSDRQGDASRETGGSRPRGTARDVEGFRAASRSFQGVAQSQRAKLETGTCRNISLIRVLTSLF